MPSRRARDMVDSVGSYGRNAEERHRHREVIKRCSGGGLKAVMRRRQQRGPWNTAVGAANQRVA